jgi:hypothetical protein
MGAVLGFSVAMAAPPMVIGVQAMVLGASAAFILTRPLPPEG